MEQKVFYNVDDICKILTVKKSFAYRLIRKLNTELSQQGFITVAGKVSKKYFDKKLYGDN